MTKKVLFLNGYAKTEFYNNERNKYKGITATNIFKSDSIFNKMLRKFFLFTRLPFLYMLYGEWKYDVKSYDVIILSASHYSLYIYKYIKRNSSARIIHWYWNPLINEIMPNKIRSTDTDIFSFDINDCEKHNMKYISTYYFSTIKIPENNIEYDIYFMGADKGRLNKLIELDDEFSKQGLKVYFHITKSSNLRPKTNYNFKPRISYTEVLNGISKCHAILDFVQDGQNGLTQRPMEALFHRKKLITNNLNIVTCDFYHPNNIFILGYDDILKIKKFIELPYSEIDSKVLNKYDFGNWIENISS